MTFVYKEQTFMNGKTSRTMFSVHELRAQVIHERQISAHEYCLMSQVKENYIAVHEH